VQRTLPDVKGENVATLMLDFSGVTCTIDLAYALNSVYPEVFPQTLALIEGADGTLEILPDYRLRICHREGTREEIASPTLYSWVDPRYAVVQSSAVDAQRNLRDALAGGGEAETTGADNLRSLELVFAAYDSAAKRRVAHINE
jgi:predicted dehydrogenase